VQGDVPLEGMMTTCQFSRTGLCFHKTFRIPPLEHKSGLMAPFESNTISSDLLPCLPACLRACVPACLRACVPACLLPGLSLAIDGKYDLLDEA
jgi:hypothetical protein